MFFISLLSNADIFIYNLHGCAPHRYLLLAKTVPAVSQGSVDTCLRCGWIVSGWLRLNLGYNLSWFNLSCSIIVFGDYISFLFSDVDVIFVLAYVYCIVLILFFLLALIFIFSVLVKRLAGKSVSDVTNLVSGAMINVDSISQSVSDWLYYTHLLPILMMKESWKLVSIWWSYEQEYSDTFLTWYIIFEATPFSWFSFCCFSHLFSLGDYLFSAGFGITKGRLVE